MDAERSHGGQNSGVAGVQELQNGGQIRSLRLDLERRFLTRNVMNGSYHRIKPRRLRIQNAGVRI
jgi:hypothetical protein